MKKVYDNEDLVPLLCCIINISPLRNFLVLNKKEILSFSKEISDIIVKMKDDINIIKYINFDNFSKLIGTQKETYVSTNLCKFLYTEMYKELNTKDINAFINNIVDSDQTNLWIELNKMRNIFGIRNKSIISDTFYFEEIIMNKCRNCGIITANCEMNNSFNFILDDILNFKLNNNNNNCQRFNKVNLYDCFDFLTSEKQNYILCKKCNYKNNCPSCYYINTPPEIMTIILDRRTNNFIDFGIDFKFDLDNYLYKWENFKEKNTKYELIGMVTNLGSENSGHSAFFISSIDMNWYCYNSLNFKIINDIFNEYKGIPYLLFYKKRID